MNNLLEDLKNVNPKMPGSWPLPIKLGAFTLMLLGVVVAGALLDWQDEWDRLTVIRTEENTLKEAYLAKKKQAVNLDLIKKQLIETQQAFGALLKQLPTKSEMAALLTDINQAGLGRGLLFDLFKPGPEVATGVFTEQPITIKVTGSYDDLGKFASDISMMPRIVTLNDISIVPVAGGQLVMDATAKTYRYLDDAELSAQKKPAGAKRK
ncbi:MAG: pilus assembly protein PilO [Gallionellales bacterium 35-53-114]|jgi:type IV pilus assembly protein PilO|nr:MAG: pilus assembly protein PilO [Gallionellales bacterium 35-53-114]OYZ62379.1 MAG: pilus assembly protein PilO [Gallionellales bacterium 24-53-125]OZB07418.1 MAG: pilus assembly protein PilO [Gallionellales bacterium 39-52-133]HQS59595.1 type 4a pilus biogenesis protein PilO [Gallionellaceae bacterium]HQS75502.1 type 4a pilus biogenesis protein PilO [Gallionellaceae bacterium]